MEKAKECIIRFTAGQEVNLKLIKVVDGIARYEASYTVIEESERRNTFRIILEQSLLSHKEKLFLRII
ncbi:MAG TPA: hypothetical protein VN026_12405 [Bacteroidia bacterium]|jgi:hypothetical protein|nr:hypothetical protein [Bacteroidia bacterium]